MTKSTKRPLRADAERNRARVLDSAVRLFSERGLDATVESIAKDAGVGVGTVYRRFPTREALIEAAYRNELDLVCAAAAQLVDTLPPDQAAREWMNRFLDYMTAKSGMAEALRAVISSGGDPFAHSRDRLNGALETLFRATTDAGITREGVPVDDVLMSLSGIALAAGDPSQREQAGRMVDLLFAGITLR